MLGDLFANGTWLYPSWYHWLFIFTVGSFIVGLIFQMIVSLIDIFKAYSIFAPEGDTHPNPLMEKMDMDDDIQRKYKWSQFFGIHWVAGTAILAFLFIFFQCSMERTLKMDIGERYCKVYMEIRNP